MCGWNMACQRIGGLVKKKPTLVVAVDGANASHATFNWFVEWANIKDMSVKE